MDEPKHEHIPFIQISVVMGPHPEDARVQVPYIYGLTKDGHIFEKINYAEWDLVGGLKVYEPIIEEEP